MRESPWEKSRNAHCENDLCHVGMDRYPLPTLSEGCALLKGTRYNENELGNVPFSRSVAQWECEPGVMPHRSRTELDSFRMAA